MKKKIEPEERLWRQLRSAIRLQWSRSYLHRQAIALAVKDKKFTCPICKVVWDAFAARVDHNPGLGYFHSFDEFVNWTRQCLYGPVRILCKPCHDKVTAQQRKKAK